MVGESVKTKFMLLVESWTKILIYQCGYLKRYDNMNRGSIMLSDLKKLGFGFTLLLFSFSAAADNWSLQTAEEAFANGDAPTAVAHWRGLAELGDVVAMNNLGYAYEKGIVVPQSNQDALGWYVEAANKGFPTAMFNVGEAIYEGRGTKKDVTEALKWLILSGSKGDSDAQILASKIAGGLDDLSISEAIRLANSWRQPK